MPDVAMPRLSDSMEEGTILKWLKRDGDEVARGDELVEIETDKATMTHEADSAGVLSIVAQEGETLPIGAVIARIGAGVAEPAEDEAPVEEEAPAAPAEVPAASATDGTPAPTPAPEPEPAIAVAPATEAPPADGNGARAKASPLARRIARERGVDLSTLEGTGPGGRIVRADVEAAVGGPPAEAPAAPAEVVEEAPTTPPPQPVAAETGTAKGDVTIRELT